MARQLTEQQRAARMMAWEEYQTRPFVTSKQLRTSDGFIAFATGFDAGLTCKEAEIEALQDRLDYMQSVINSLQGG